VQLSSRANRSKAMNVLVVDVDSNLDLPKLSWRRNTLHITIANRRPTIYEQHGSFEHVKIGVFTRSGKPLRCAPSSDSLCRFEP
jgi:CO dehydrogenase nickel-insertion accessory protein CooC1